MWQPASASTAVPNEHLEAGVQSELRHGANIIKWVYLGGFEPHLSGEADDRVYGGPCVPQLRLHALHFGGEAHRD
jgi:hypothetical protein